MAKEPQMQKTFVREGSRHELIHDLSLLVILLEITSE